MKWSRPIVFTVLLVVLPLTAQGASILIYGPSMGDTPNEQTVAEGEGHDVTVVEEAAWSAMSQGDFDAYDAIVFGDNGCGDGYEVFDTVEANQDDWGPIVTGNVVVHTFDPFAHTGDAGAIPLVENGINWVASSGSGRTGLYLSTGCYPSGTETLDFMATFGTFITISDDGDDVTVENPGHPVLDGLSETDLEGWGDSYHGQFTEYPGTFSLVATGDTDAVILARAAASMTDVPALSPSALALLGLMLGGAALIALRR